MNAFANDTALRTFTAELMFSSDAYLVDSKLLWGVSIFLSLLIARIVGWQSSSKARTLRLPRLPGLPWAGRFWEGQDLGIGAAWRLAEAHKKLGPIYESVSFGVRHVWVGQQQLAQDILVNRGRRCSHWNQSQGVVGSPSAGSSPLANISAKSPRVDRRRVDSPCASGHGFNDLPKQPSRSDLGAEPLHETEHILRGFCESPERWAEVVLKRDTGRTSRLPAHFESREGLREDEEDLGEDHELPESVALTTTALHSFFTAICFHSSQLQCLQKELDAICRSNLPTARDLSQLPLLRAVVKETLRWRPLTPFSAPYIAEDDGVYDGYHVPKGAVVHVNNYAITRDPAAYPQPDDFVPNRWLDPIYPTFEKSFAFDSGVTTAEGMDAVEMELCLLIGAIAWSFDIKRKDGRAGYDNPVLWYDPNPLASMTMRPFALDIQARTEEKKRMILNGP